MHGFFGHHVCVCTYYTYISNIQIVEGFCREPKCQKMQFRREAVPHWLLQMIKINDFELFFFKLSSLKSINNFRNFSNFGPMQ